MITSQEFLQVVNRLRAEWVALLGEQDAAALGRWMSETTLDDAEQARQTASRVLDLLKAHPQARQRISDELHIDGDLIQAIRTYDPLVGGPPSVEAGTLMVCPVDPSHCRKWLRQKGKKLFCAEHNVALVPADQVEPGGQGE